MFPSGTGISKVPIILKISRLLANAVPAGETRKRLKQDLAAGSLTYTRAKYIRPSEFSFKVPIIAYFEPFTGRAPYLGVVNCAAVVEYQSG